MADYSDKDKKRFIKRLTDRGMSEGDAIEEWGIFLAEIDAYGEIASKKKNKKAVKVKRKVA